MGPGSIVAVRHHLADIGHRFPTLTGFGMTVRWLGWSVYAAPVGSVGWLVLYAHVVVLGVAAVAGWVPFGLAGDALAGWWHLVAGGRAHSAKTGALTVAATFGAVAWLATRDEIKIGKVRVPGPRAVKRTLFSRPGRWGMWLFGFTVTWFTLGAQYLLFLVVLVVALRAADTALAVASEWYDGRAQYGRFRREFPVQWAIVASKSPHVQSITDTSGESDVSALAVSRPILEAPAQWVLPRQVAPYVFECPAWRSPGRGLQTLREVLDELAAQFPSVRDSDHSIELIWPNRDGTNFASWAWIRVAFKDRAERAAFVGGGRSLADRLFARHDEADDEDEAGFPA